MQSFQITRRCLPHWQQPGSIYFITWRVKNGETLAPEEREIWQDERYDRMVRDENEFLEKWHYIRNNPVKLGLSDRPEDYPWLYEKDGRDTG